MHETEKYEFINTYAFQVIFQKLYRTDEDINITFHVFIDLYTTKKKEITFRKTFHAIKLRLSWQKNISLASLHNHSVFIWKNCSIVRGRSYKTWFSRTMCKFSIIFLCRRMFVTLCSCLASFTASRTCAPRYGVCYSIFLGEAEQNSP